MKLSEAKRHLEFKKLPVDKQIELYLYSMQGEPPRPSFDDDIASRGKEAIPFLLKKLRTETKEYRQVAIIHVFELMHLKYENLRSEPDVMSTLEDVIAKMSDSDWKRMAQRAFRTIQEEPSRPDPASTPLSNK